MEKWLKLKLTAALKPKFTVAQHHTSIGEQTNRTAPTAERGTHAMYGYKEYQRIYG